MSYLYLRDPQSGFWYRFDYLAPVNHVRAHARVCRANGLTAFASRMPLRVPGLRKAGHVVD